MKNHYAQLQYVVQEFCMKAKIPFTGIQEDYQSRPFSLDLDEYELIKHYIKEEEREKLEIDEWLIEVKFDDVKRMILL